MTTALGVDVRQPRPTSSRLAPLVFRSAMNALGAQRDRLVAALADYTFFRETARGASDPERRARTSRRCWSNRCAPATDRRARTARLGLYESRGESRHGDCLVAVVVRARSVSSLCGVARSCLRIGSRLWPVHTIRRRSLRRTASPPIAERPTIVPRATVTTATSVLAVAGGLTGQGCAYGAREHVRVVGLRANLHDWQRNEFFDGPLVRGRDNEPWPCKAGCCRIVWR
jgi:hypothetical protein